MTKNKKEFDVNNSNERFKGAKLPKNGETRKPIFTKQEREAMQLKRKIVPIVVFLSKDRKCRLVCRPQIMPDSVEEFADTVAGNTGHFGYSPTR